MHLMHRLRSRSRGVRRPSALYRGSSSARYVASHTTATPTKGSTTMSGTSTALRNLSMNVSSGMQPSAIDGKSRLTKSKDRISLVKLAGQAMSKLTSSDVAH